MKRKGKSNLRNHQKVVHEMKRYYCDQCDFRSTSIGHLKDHKALKHSNLPLSYKCETCDFKAISEKHVKKHVKRVHMPPTTADLKRRYGTKCMKL
jgi:hypothetical protein